MLSGSGPPYLLSKLHSLGWLRAAVGWRPQDPVCLVVQCLLGEDALRWVLRMIHTIFPCFTVLLFPGSWPKPVMPFSTACGYVTVITLGPFSHLIRLGISSSVQGPLQREDSPSLLTFRATLVSGYWDTAVHFWVQPEYGVDLSVK